MLHPVMSSLRDDSKKVDIHQYHLEKRCDKKKKQCRNQGSNPQAQSAAKETIVVYAEEFSAPYQLYMGPDYTSWAYFNCIVKNARKL